MTSPLCGACIVELYKRKLVLNLLKQFDNILDMKVYFCDIFLLAGVKSAKQLKVLISYI